jgi:hypothetical protein
MRPSRTFPVGLLCVASVIAACSGGNERAGSPIACVEPGDSVLYKAATAYLRALEPKPVRFVLAPSGPDALPSAARAAVQQVGPTFLWPAGNDLQQQMRETLKQKGQFTTLLVTFKGMQRTGRDEVVVRYGGRYIGGDLDGREANVGAVHFFCETARWQLDTTMVEKAA